MEPEERLKTAATAMASDIKIQTFGGAGEKATQTVASMDVVQTIINDWNAMPKKAANEIIKKYGLPNEAIPSRLIWYNNGPWKRTIVYRDEIPHDFPQPHTDMLEQFIDYRVPIEMISEISKLDGSIIVERTKGEVSSRCDVEAANFNALNVMHDLVTGKLNVEQARKVLAENNAAYLMNRPAPYTEALQFDVPSGDTIDTDQVVIGDAIVHQASEKVNDIIENDERNRGGTYH